MAAHWMHDDVANKAATDQVFPKLATCFLVECAWTDDEPKLKAPRHFRGLDFAVRHRSRRWWGRNPDALTETTEEKPVDNHELMGTLLSCGECFLRTSP
jgi:hypothetical protein